MEKIITKPFEFLGKQITKVNCKSVKTDSEKQQVLTCDLYTTEVIEKVESDVLVYADKAYILGEQPFGLTEEEIKALRK